MPAQPPFAVGGGYNTNLDLLNELAFRQWVKSNNIPFDVNAAGPTDYDMRGYYQGMQQGNPMARPTEVNVNDGRPHFTDYYKTPLHQTFSAESQWAGPSAPNWINDHQLVSPGGRVVYDEAAPRMGSILGPIF
jgi:hypothetical protein